MHSASEFIDSVGVNTHMSDSPYASQFSRVCEFVRDSGIRHLRDELRPDNDLGVWRELFAKCGARSHLIVSPATNSVAEMLNYVNALGVEKISAIEGQNEGDSDWFVAQKAARGDWSGTVVAYQRQIFEALRRRYMADALPIVSPSVLDYKPGDMSKIAAAARYCDIVAVHSYVQNGQEPETAEAYAALPWYLLNIRDPFKPGAPAMATETGYNNLVQPLGKGVSETAAAIYIPRLLLNNFASGIKRTFLYQLLDGGSDPDDWEQHWGLVRRDMTPKPAYYTVAALIGALRDDGVTSQPSETREELAMLRGPPQATRMIHFANPDGTIVLAIWRALPCWDTKKKADLAIEPEPLTITLKRPVSKAAWMVLDGGRVWSDLRVSGGEINLMAGPRVSLVRLDGTGS